MKHVAVILSKSLATPLRRFSLFMRSCLTRSPSCWLLDCEGSPTAFGRLQTESEGKLTSTNLKLITLCKSFEGLLPCLSLEVCGSSDRLCIASISIVGIVMLLKSVRSQERELHAFPKTRGFVDVALFQFEKASVLSFR